MGYRRTMLGWFKRTFGNTATLALQWPLFEDGFSKLLNQCLIQMLLGADGIKLMFIVLLAIGVTTADTFAFLIQLIEILAQILTSGIMNLLRQFFDTRLNCSGFFVFVISLVFAIAEESATLRDVIHSTPYKITIVRAAHI